MTESTQLEKKLLVVDPQGACRQDELICVKLYFSIPFPLFMSQVYALFTVLKCNLVFVFRCFFHYHFHATCFGNSLPSSGVVQLTISLQFIVRIDVKLKYKR
jgi:hypothetical protein